MNLLWNILLVLVSLFIYFNIAWLYLYNIGDCKNWFSKFISFGETLTVVDDGATVLLVFGAYLLWPLALAAAILYWVLWRTILYRILWLIFGGAARTIVGKNLDGTPLVPTKETETNS